MTDVKLPDMPEGQRLYSTRGWKVSEVMAHTEEAMRAYATAAVMADRAERWRPIETAPKSVADGSRIDGIYLLGFSYTDNDREEGISPQACVDIMWWEPLLTNKHGTRGKWVTNRFGEVVEFEPTHWQPLPQPPAEDGE